MLNLHAAELAAEHATEPEIAVMVAAIDALAAARTTDMLVDGVRQFLRGLVAAAPKSALAGLCNFLADLQLQLALELSDRSFERWRKMTASLQADRVAIVAALRKQDRAAAARAVKQLPGHRHDADQAAALWAPQAHPQLAARRRPLGNAGGAAMSATSFDVAALIDKGPLGLYRILIVATCCAVAMIDGFDTQSIAFVAPEIASAWHVPAAQFGPVFAIGLFGGLLGAVILGAVGDRYGRKLVLLPAMALFAIASLATVTADGVTSLLVFRLVTGFGLGGAIPGVIAITSEYAPSRRRATIVTLMFCGFPLGAVLGGAMSARLIPAYGWHAVFYAGGILPLVLLPLVWLFVPESIRFLVHRRADPAATARVLRRIHPHASLPDRANFTATEESYRRLLPAPAFRRRARRGNRRCYGRPSS